MVKVGGGGMAPADLADGLVVCLRYFCGFLRRCRK